MFPKDFPNYSWLVGNLNMENIVEAYNSNSSDNDSSTQKKKESAAIKFDPIPQFEDTFFNKQKRMISLQKR